jgi:EF hand
MRPMYSIIVLAAVLPSAFLIAGDEGASPRDVVAEPGKKQKKIKQPKEFTEPTAVEAPKPPKPPKAPKAPPDEDEILSRAADKWARGPKTERDKLIEELTKAFKEEVPAAAGDAEFLGWFDREQFLSYARRYLRPGDSPPWDNKPPKDPLDEAGKTFRKLDRDNDGSLDADEMPPGLRGDWQRWDKNRDGRIDVEEYTHYFKARLQHLAWERGVPLPGKQPAEGPVEQPRQRPTVYRPGRMPAGLPAWFVQCDKDSDGQVGLYEWKAQGLDVEEFLRLDTNRDGFITAEEMLRARRTATVAAAPR